MRSFYKLVALVLLVVSVNVVTTLVVSSTVAPTSAGGAGTPVRSSGDTNGDGQIDVADAIGLLDYLFNNGVAPVACATEVSSSDLRPFFPAPEDVFRWEGRVSGLDPVDVITVPPGKVLILTGKTVEPVAAFLLVDGQVHPSNTLLDADVLQPKIPFESGSSLSFQVPTGAPAEIVLYGYWANSSYPSTPFADALS